MLNIIPLQEIIGIILHTSSPQIERSHDTSRQEWRDMKRIESCACTNESCHTYECIIITWEWALSRNFMPFRCHSNSTCVYIIYACVAYLDHSFLCVTWVLVSSQYIIHTCIHIYKYKMHTQYLHFHASNGGCWYTLIEQTLPHQQNTGTHQRKKTDTYRGDKQAHEMLIDTTVKKGKQAKLLSSQSVCDEALRLVGLSHLSVQVSVCVVNVCACVCVKHIQNKRTHWAEWLGSFVTRLLHICDMTHWHAQFLIFTCATHLKCVKQHMCHTSSV